MMGGARVLFLIHGAGQGGGLLLRIPRGGALGVVALVPTKASFRMCACSAPNCQNIFATFGPFGV